MYRGRIAAVSLLSVILSLVFFTAAYAQTKITIDASANNRCVTGANGKPLVWNCKYPAKDAKGNTCGLQAPCSGKQDMGGRSFSVSGHCEAAQKCKAEKYVDQDGKEHDIKKIEQQIDQSVKQPETPKTGEEITKEVQDANKLDQSKQINCSLGTCESAPAQNSSPVPKDTPKYLEEMGLGGGEASPAPNMSRTADNMQTYLESMGLGDGMGQGAPFSGQSLIEASYFDLSQATPDWSSFPSESSFDPSGNEFTGGPESTGFSGAPQDPMGASDNFGPGDPQGPANDFPAQGAAPLDNVTNPWNTSPLPETTAPPAVPLPGFDGTPLPSAFAPQPEPAFTNPISATDTNWTGANPGLENPYLNLTGQDIAANGVGKNSIDELNSLFATPQGSGKIETPLDIATAKEPVTFSGVETQRTPIAAFDTAFVSPGPGKYASDSQIDWTGEQCTGIACGVHIEKVGDWVYRENADVTAGKIAEREQEIARQEYLASQVANDVPAPMWGAQSTGVPEFNAQKVTGFADATAALGGSLADGQPITGEISNETPKVPAETTKDAIDNAQAAIKEEGLSPGTEAPANAPTEPAKSYLADQREQLMAELDTNSALRTKVAAVIAKEMGGGGVGSQAVLESMVNRSVMKGYSSLDQAINDGFYGPVNRGVVDKYIASGVSQSDLAAADKVIAQVAAGSNICNFCTDQGMANEIRGPKVAIGGEYFGYMNGNSSWSDQQRQSQAVYESSGGESGSGSGSVPTNTGSVGNDPFAPARSLGEIDSRLQNGTEYSNVPLPPSRPDSAPQLLTYPALIPVEFGGQLSDNTPDYGSLIPKAEWDPSAYTAERGQQITDEVQQVAVREAQDAQLADRLAQADAETAAYRQEQDAKLAEVIRADQAAYDEADRQAAVDEAARQQVIRDQNLALELRKDGAPAELPQAIVPGVESPVQRLGQALVTLDGEGIKSAWSDMFNPAPSAAAPDTTSRFTTVDEASQSIATIQDTTVPAAPGAPLAFASYGTDGGLSGGFTKDFGGLAIVSEGEFSRFVASESDVAGRGIGSDYVSSGGIGVDAPQGPLTNTTGGIGSDYVSSGGAQGEVPLPTSRPLDIPLAETSGGRVPDILAANSESDSRLQPAYTQPAPLERLANPDAQPWNSVAENSGNPFDSEGQKAVTLKCAGGGGACGPDSTIAATGGSPLTGNERGIAVPAGSGIEIGERVRVQVRDKVIENVPVTDYTQTGSKNYVASGALEKELGGTGKDAAIITPVRELTPAQIESRIPVPAWNPEIFSEQSGKDITAQIQAESEKATTDLKQLAIDGYNQSPPDQIGEAIPTEEPIAPEDAKRIAETLTQSGDAPTPDTSRKTLGSIIAESDKGSAEETPEYKAYIVANGTAPVNQKVLAEWAEKNADAVAKEAAQNPVRPITTPGTWDTLTTSAKGAIVVGGIGCVVGAGPWGCAAGAALGAYFGNTNESQARGSVKFPDVTYGSGGGDVSQVMAQPAALQPEPTSPAPAPVVASAVADQQSSQSNYDAARGSLTGAPPAANNVAQVAPEFKTPAVPNSPITNQDSGGLGVDTKGAVNPSFAKVVANTSPAVEASQTGASESVYKPTRTSWAPIQTAPAVSPSLPATRSAGLDTVRPASVQNAVSPAPAQNVSPVQSRPFAYSESVPYIQQSSPVPAQNTVVQSSSNIWANPLSSVNKVAVNTTALPAADGTAEVSTLQPRAITTDVRKSVTDVVQNLAGIVRAPVRASELLPVSTESTPVLPAVAGTISTDTIGASFNTAEGGGASLIELKPSVSVYEYPSGATHSVVRVTEILPQDKKVAVIKLGNVLIDADARGVAALRDAYDEKSGTVQVYVSQSDFVLLELMMTDGIAPDLITIYPVPVLPGGIAVPAGRAVSIQDIFANEMLSFYSNPHAASTTPVSYVNWSPGIGKQSILPANGTAGTTGSLSGTQDASYSESTFQENLSTTSAQSQNKIGESLYDWVQGIQKTLKSLFGN